MALARSTSISAGGVPFVGDMRELHADQITEQLSCEMRSPGARGCKLPFAGVFLQQGNQFGHIVDAEAPG